MLRTRVYPVTITTKTEAHYRLQPESIKVIHYHGTPIGGTRQDAARFLMGRHALVPFSYPEDIAIVADVCQSFCLDNGAFTAWKKGGAVDVNGYMKWVLEWYRHPGFDFALIPDVIDGTEKDNDEMLRAWPKALPGVPVWHMHEPIARLSWLARSYRMVALGSSGEFSTPGTSDWWGRMNMALKAICDDKGRPICKLHGLRMLDPQVFTKLPLSSADSTNAAVNSGSLSRFGMYQPPTTAQRAAVIAARIEAHNSAAIFNPSAEEQLCLV